MAQKVRLTPRCHTHTPACQGIIQTEDGSCKDGDYDASPTCGWASITDGNGAKQNIPCVLGIIGCWVSTRLSFRRAEGGRPGRDCSWGAQCVRCLQNAQEALLRREQRQEDELLSAWNARGRRKLPFSAGGLGRVCMWVGRGAKSAGVQRAAAAAGSALPCQLCIWGAGPWHCPSQCLPTQPRL